jgi:3-oxoacyl-[acyl-carrier protein] reductase
LALKQNGAGAIVNIGGLSAHTGAKAGLIGFTRALELADDKHGVPSQMAIPRQPGVLQPRHESLVQTLVGRRGVADDIAGAVRFLTPAALVDHQEGERAPTSSLQTRQPHLSSSCTFVAS